MIAPHIFVLSTFLSIVWGWHLLDASRDWQVIRAKAWAQRAPGQLAGELRNLVAAICLFAISVAYLFRTAVVLAGLGETFAGQVVFFALVGVNVTGAVFVVASRRIR